MSRHKYRYPKYRIRRRNQFSLSFSPKLNEKQTRGIIIIALFVLSVIFFLSLIGIAGRLGGILKNGLLFSFGKAAYLIPFLLAGFAFAFIKEEKEKDFEIRKANLIGAAFFILGFSSLCHLLFVSGNVLESSKLTVGGGYLGYGATALFLSLMGFWATLIFSFAFFCAGVVLMWSLSFSDFVSFFKKIREISLKIWQAFSHRAFPEEKIEIKGLPTSDSLKGRAQELFKKHKGITDEEIKDQEKEKTKESLETIDFKVKPVQDLKEKIILEKPPFSSASLWQPFPLTLLESHTSLPTSGDIKSNVKIIAHTLYNFGIEVEMGEVNVGPTVTQYTLKPAEGVKLSKITSLQNDLSLALAAHPIRIEAPIPGRSLVGIEMPNKAASLVRLHGLLESEEYQKAKSPLAIILGRNVAGKPVLASLEKMPHLLISGATGSGKSIFINTTILTLLYRNSPSDLKLILVDPKKVEMTSYNKIPHLLTPVICEVPKTINALRWLISEMDRRFRLFAESGSRDILSYNQKFRQNRLPFITLIIDELADLMAQAAAEVEACIVRLAQMARATGIHLILATQRPSVDVITGLIKANITGRIAFAVASMVDSRTILDISGAEKLLGNGDMLYIHSDLGKPKRIQGPYVSEEEIKKVCNWFTKLGAPEFREEVIKTQSLPATIFPKSGQDSGVDDELFEEAKKVVVEAKKASASLLQRRLSIGYARAARLLDIMQEKGIVGPADGAKPREVLVSQQNNSNAQPPPAENDNVEE
ncbi:MAG: DNA translocase FtsK 4TM domain-containing protein [Patescibacteria group bacterium]